MRIRTHACSVRLVWSDLCLLHWQADSLPLSHQGSPALILISKIFPLNIICLDYWVDDPLKFWAQDKCYTYFILVTSRASPSKCHLIKIIIFCGVCPRLLAGLNFGYDSGSLTSLFFLELHSIYQQIWKTQQWSQDWKRSVFIPIPKKGNAKECLNYCTIQ